MSRLITLITLIALLCLASVPVFAQTGTPKFEGRLQKIQATKTISANAT